MTDDPIDVALLVTSVFDRLGISYYVGGSIASTYYGQIRTTHDIDLIADLYTDHVESLVKELRGQFYVDAEMILDAIRTRRSFNLLHYESTYKVDVFVPPMNASLEMRFRRRIRQPVKETTREQIYFSSPEDVILSKIEWYQLGNRVSERQWADILGVIQVQAGRLDREYLKRWAAELGVADLLERAYREAGQ